MTFISVASTGFSEIRDNNIGNKENRVEKNELHWRSLEGLLGVELKCESINSDFADLGRTSFRRSSSSSSSNLFSRLKLMVAYKEKDVGFTRVPWNECLSLLSGLRA